MLILETIPLLRNEICRWRQESKRIALVPTMGNLHEGHLQLVKAAKARADNVVVSIFVNPMQFEHADALAHYPRTLQEDCEKLNPLGVNIVFAPNAESLYPHDLEKQTCVSVPTISILLEDALHSGHFCGVTTVISKLFNLIQPDIACFGEKDYQKLAVIRKMVLDLNYSIDVISIPTVRAKDGLALSYRNNYLSDEQRQAAPVLYRTMNQLAERLSLGERMLDNLLAEATKQLQQAGLTPDRLCILDADTLEQVTVDSQRAVILMAAWLGKTRLIDNQVVSLLD